MANYGGFESRKFLLTPFDVLRGRQFKVVEQAVVEAEQGRHIHYQGGSLVWCNWDSTCEGSRPISELLS